MFGPVPSLHDQPLAAVPPETLYRILQLRSQVFVVEQDCVFLDLDGRDLDDGCRQLWIEDDAGDVLAVAARSSTRARPATSGAS